jgi:late competence protein required for DNA uptake (superfamily II DNA/RNA helicase)|tara:strand:- start:42 stop:212 length:171 start_codon:yes stop_codon:yes gene_type:complete
MNDKASRCTKCGGEREALYEVNWIPVYYCQACGITDHGSNLELYGPEERAADEAGE